MLAEEQVDIWCGFGLCTGRGLGWLIAYRQSHYLEKSVVTAEVNPCTLVMSPTSIHGYSCTCTWCKFLQDTGTGSTQSLSHRFTRSYKTWETMSTRG